MTPVFFIQPYIVSVSTQCPQPGPGALLIPMWSLPDLFGLNIVTLCSLCSPSPWYPHGMTNDMHGPYKVPSYYLPRPNTTHLVYPWSDQPGPQWPLLGPYLAATWSKFDKIPHDTDGFKLLYLTCYFYKLDLEKRFCLYKKQFILLYYYIYKLIMFCRCLQLFILCVLWL